MSNNTTQHDRNSEWFYDRARSYPLLDRDQEHSIDQTKWQSLDDIFRLLLEDRAGRTLIQQWAHLLINVPPALPNFKERKHYFTLRREHQPILAKDNSTQVLDRLARGRAEGLDHYAGRQEFLSGSLIPIGLAKLLQRCPDTNETSAALAYWRGLHDVAPLDPPGDAVANCLTIAMDAYFEARSRLINHNLRLVFSIARKLEGRQSFEDLCQDGFIGLIRAAEKYSFLTGHRFSTYAYNWIMQTCRRGDEEMGALIRFPTNIKDQITAIVKERVRLTQQQGATPSRRQLADGLDMDLTSLESIMTLGNLSISTDTQIAGEESTVRLGDTLVDEAFGTPEIDTDSSDLKHLIETRLARLKPIERQVVTRRWGLDQAPVSSRKQLALQLSVSVEWIRQVENNALKKLRSDHVIREAKSDFLDS